MEVGRERETKSGGREGLRDTVTDNRHYMKKTSDVQALTYLLMTSLYLL